MIRFAAADFEGAVELLDEEEADDLVGEGEGGEGDGFGGGGEDGGGEAEGAADGEGEVAFAGEGEGGEAGGEVFGGEGGAAAVEDDEAAGGADGFEQPLPFPGEDFGLVGGRRAVRHFFFGDFDDVEAAVGGEALYEFADAVREVAFFYFADGDDGDAHGATGSAFLRGGRCGWRSGRSC
jgi:hypothetical protein